MDTTRGFSDTTSSDMAEPPILTDSATQKRLPGNYSYFIAD